MTKTFSRLLAIGAALTLGAGSAQANVMFNLSGATLATSTGLPVGTLTGTFTTNDALSSVVSYDITASAAGLFAGFEYKPSNSTVTAQTLPSQYFQIDSTGNTNELRLFFASGLTRAGGTLNATQSYESEPSGGTRFVSGAVVPAPVPEAASWAMMIVGMGAMGYAFRRQRAGVRVSSQA